MKDALRKFVGENREAFDDQEPRAGLWSRINDALPGARQRRLWDSVILWRAAAAVFLGLSIYLFAVRDANHVPKAAVAQGQHEFSDLESFYQHEIEQKVELINHLDANGESDHVTQSVKKLDAMYLVLADELKNNPDKKVRDAMILNLLVRIDLLNQQLKKLEDDRKAKMSNKPSEV